MLNGYKDELYELMAIAMYALVLGSVLLGLITISEISVVIPALPGNF